MTDPARGSGDLTGRLVGDIDSDLSEFLRTRANTFLKWDLVRFFHENPHTTDTAENIGRYTGRDPIAIANELGEMAGAGLLDTHFLGDMAIYTLTENRETRALIARFIEACQNRTFKVKAVYQVIRGMR